MQMRFGSYKSVLCVVVLVTAAPLMAVQSPGTTADEDISLDLSKGATFRFTIGQKLAPYIFKAVGDPKLKTIDHIDVYREPEKEPIQTLHECRMEEAPYRGAKWFRAEDFNFDGYQDIWMLASWGATGNESGCVWLFDSKSGKFAYSREFSELGTYKLDPGSRTIITTSVGGMAGQVHRITTYEVIDDRPFVVQQEDQDWDDQKCAFVRVLRKRKDGQLMVINRGWVKDETIDCKSPK